MVILPQVRFLASVTNIVMISVMMLCWDFSNYYDDDDDDALSYMSSLGMQIV